MSYPDFQQAATQIIRTPEVFLENPGAFLASFDLTTDERKNLDFCFAIALRRHISKTCA